MVPLRSSDLPGSGGDPNKSSGSPICGLTVYISEVSGGKKVKSDAQVAEH